MRHAHGQVSTKKATTTYLLSFSSGAISFADDLFFQKKSKIQTTTVVKHSRWFNGEIRELSQCHPKEGRLLLFFILENSGPVFLEHFFLLLKFGVIFCGASRSLLWETSLALARVFYLTCLFGPVCIMSWECLSLQLEDFFEFYW